MSWDPEPAVAALFELVKDVEPVRYSDRLIRGIDGIPELPACFVAIAGANVDADHQRPLKWTLVVGVHFIARVDGSESSPEEKLNEWLVNLQDTVAQAGDLDGTCEHCQISGEVEILPPTNDDPVMTCTVPVEILGVG